MRVQGTQGRLLRTGTTPRVDGIARVAPPAAVEPASVAVVRPAAPSSPSAGLDGLLPLAQEWFPPTCAPPDVTVIVRFLDGRRAWLEAAIQSVLDQAGVSVEVLVIDDGSASPPGPFDDPRVGLLRHGVNRGLGQARNSGVRLARGRWVTMLDYDDERLPGTLARQIHDAEAHGASLAFAGLEVMDVPGAGDWQRTELHRVWDGQAGSLRDTLLARRVPDNLVSCGSLVWRRERYPLLVPPDFGSCDDFAFVQEALLAARPDEVRFLDEAVYRYRLASPTSVRGSESKAMPGGQLRAHITDYCVRKVPDYVRYLELARNLREPLRVAFVERDLGMGGAQWQVALVALHADPRVIRFRFLCEFDTPLAAWLMARGQTVQIRPAELSREAWLRQEVEAWRPHVLDSAWYPHALGLRELGCAVTVHAAGMKLWWHRQDEQAGLLLDGVICEAQAIKEAYPQWGDRAHVIPNAIDVEPFRDAEHRRPAARALLGLPQDAVVIGFCARMTASEKRIDLLRGLIERLHAERPEVWWAVAGHFSEHAPNHQAQVEEWRQFIAGRPVAWLGAMQPWQAPAWHAAQDVYLCCSDSEGLSLSMLEAMAAGAVVVTTACGGHGEAVDEGFGRVVGIGDLDGLYRALLELVDRPAAERRAMGLFARHVCAAKYHIAENVRRHVAAYAAMSSLVSTVVT